MGSSMLNGRQLPWDSSIAQTSGKLADVDGPIELHRTRRLSGTHRANRSRPVSTACRPSAALLAKPRRGASDKRLNECPELPGGRDMRSVRFVGGRRQVGRMETSQISARRVSPGARCHNPCARLEDNAPVLNVKRTQVGDLPQHAVTFSTFKSGDI